MAQNATRSTTPRDAASVSILWALYDGVTEVNTIAVRVGRSRAAVTQALSRMRTQQPALVKRVGAFVPGTVGAFEITRAGTKTFKARMQALEALS